MSFLEPTEKEGRRPEGMITPRKASLPEEHTHFRVFARKIGAVKVLFVWKAEIN